MKAAIATGVENIDEVIYVEQNWEKPTLSTALDGKTGKLITKENHMIVKVLACALAPGDTRLLRGKTDMMQLPKSGRPYVIGSDICGIVSEIACEESYFQIGDLIIARFDEPQPHGMCAEYACVKTKLSEKCPESIVATEACTLPASAAAARLMAQTYIKPNYRVLVLGGSGGVGTFFCQYAKVYGATFLAATSTQENLLRELGVDKVIDYRCENWWEIDYEQPFDVILDLVNGTNWEQGACSGNSKVIKGKNTTYIQLLTGVETEISSKGFGLFSFMFTILWRFITSKVFCSTRPAWVSPKGLELTPGDLRSILEDVATKKN